MKKAGRLAPLFISGGDSELPPFFLRQLCVLAAISL
jgi:hypothetical protein